MKRKIVFLDRDGVLTIPIDVGRKGYAPRLSSDVEIYPGSRSSVFHLRQMGFEVVVVTNQPDVARGLISLGEMNAINSKVARMTNVDRIRTCPHAEEDSCVCRKPLAGLLLAETEFGPIDFAESWMVGDRDKDIAAGAKVGCRTIFVNRSWEAESGSQACFIVRELPEAVALISLATKKTQLESNDNPEHRNLCRRCSSF